MKHIFKDSLIVLTALTLTGASTLVFNPSEAIEPHASAQSVQTVSAPTEPVATEPTPAPVEQLPKPAEKPAVAPEPKPTPEPVKTKVDSTIPARVFCGSPQQRTWKTPLLENATMGREMAAAKGWSGAQWDALYELWSCESSWNNFARNASSAFGIAQFLDSTWGLPGLAYANCSKTVDPREQIRCGLEYIQVVYGSPASALAKHYRDNSY